MNKIAMMTAALLMTAGAAAAQDAPLAKMEARAQLATPVASIKRAIVDGRAWKCEGDVCIGTATATTKSQPFARECKRAATALGEIKTYRSWAPTGDQVSESGCGA